MGYQNTMTRLLTLTLLSTFVLNASAFSTASFPTKTFAPTSTSLNVLLSEEDTQAIMQTAHDCAEGECSVDDVSGLIFELKEQQKEMNERLEEMMNMVSHLQKLNESNK